MDIIPFYMERKARLDDIKRRHNSSSLKSRMVNLLSKEAGEMIVDTIEDYISNDVVIENDSTFDERLAKFLEAFNEKEKRNKDT